MTKFFWLFAVLLCSSFAHGQNKPAENVDRITDRQIIKLPKLKSSKPRLEMQKAMKLVEKYIRKEKIDTSDFFLSQIRMIQYGSENNKKPAWYFWWLNVDGALGNYIEIIVFMDGSTRRIPSM